MYLPWISMLTKTKLMLTQTLWTSQKLFRCTSKSCSRASVTSPRRELPAFYQTTKRSRSKNAKRKRRGYSWGPKWRRQEVDPPQERAKLAKKLSNRPHLLMRQMSTLPTREYPVVLDPTLRAYLWVMVKDSPKSKLRQTTTFVNKTQYLLIRWISQNFDRRKLRSKILIWRIKF